MNTTNNKGAPRDGTPSKTPPGNSNSTAAQRKRLIDWLKTHGSIDTITARRELDILMPAARIHELRHGLGHRIDTVKTQRPTDCGKLHNVGLYVLNGEV